MEFPFNIQKLLPSDEDGVAILQGMKFKSTPISKNYQFKQSGPVQPIETLIDELGNASAKVCSLIQAQGLKAVITTYSKFAGSDNTIFLLFDENYALGFLKIGKKKLFYRDYFGKVTEMNPVCVLDFYVHESVQRKGYGKLIFEKFLDFTGILPRKLAYDRPSPKLLGFLSKYYGLTNYTPQNNNFVVYDEYFLSETEMQKSSQKPRNGPANFPLPLQTSNKEINQNSESSGEDPELLRKITETELEIQRLQEEINRIHLEQNVHPSFPSYNQPQSVKGQTGSLKTPWAVEETKVNVLIKFTGVKSSNSYGDYYRKR